MTLLLFGGSQGSASTLATKDGVLASEIAQVSESWVAMTGTAMPEEQQGTSGARIAAVLFCQTLVDMYMAKRAGVATPDSGRAAAVRAGSLLLGRIAEVSRADEAVVGAVPFKGSAVHRKKTRVWQALAVLAQFSEAAPGTLTVEEVLSTLQQREIASVKQYQEAGAPHAWPDRRSILSRSCSAKMGNVHGRPDESVTSVLCAICCCTYV